MWYDISTRAPITHVDIDARVIAYGDGFFTTMAVVAGEINWFEYHQKRCDLSAKCLQLTLDRDALTQALQQFAQQMQNGMLKLIVCRKNQAVRGYGFDNGNADSWLKVMPNIAIGGKQSPNQMNIQTPASAVCLSQQIACLPTPLVGLKLLNAQDKALAHAELLRHQRQHPDLIEGLVQDVMGNWVEGTFCNVFYQLNHQNQWFTPPIHQSGVNGVMRQVLLNQHLKTNSQERVLTTADFSQLSALFFCNAVRGILPIHQLYLPNSEVLSLTIKKNFV